VLTDAFVPYLEPVAPECLPNRQNREEIHVVVDPALSRLLRTRLAEHAEAAKRAEPQPSDVACRDDTVILRQLDDTSLENRHPAGFVLWSRSSPFTSYIVLPDERRGSARSLFRAVRAVAARLLLDAGWLPLHAAGFVTAAGAVLLTGARGSGKTTALLRMLATGTTALLANNRVFLGGHPVAPVVRALPASVAIRTPTLDLLPQLRPLAEAAARPLWETETTPTGRRETRLLVPPRTLVETLGVYVVPLAPLRAVIDIAHRQGSQPSQWTLLQTPEREVALRAACRPDWFRDEAHERLRSSAAEAKRGEPFARWAAVIGGARFQRGDRADVSLLECVERVLARPGQ
jgi:hypothetical protein